MQAGPPPAEELQRVLVTVAVGLGLLGLLAGYVQYKSRMMISRSSARRQAEAGEALGRAGGTAGPAVESRPVRDIMKQPALPKVSSFKFEMFDSGDLTSVRDVLTSVDEDTLEVHKQILASLDFDELRMAEELTFGRSVHD